MTALSPAVTVVRRIAELHDDHHTGTVQVIPVLLSPDTTVPDIAEATITANGGLYANSEERSGGDWVYDTAVGVGPSDVVISTAIDAAFTMPHPTRPRTVEFGVDNTRTSVNFNELAGTPGSEADQRLLRLARAVLNPELSKVPIAAIFVQEAGLDLSYRRAIWSLVRQLDGIALGALRTLVLLVQVESGIDVGIHCLYQGGFRVGLIDGKVVERHDAVKLPSQVRAIADSHPDDASVFFLGAGFSATSGIPLGNRLRDESLKRQIGEGADLMTDQELTDTFRKLESSRLTADEGEMTPEEFHRTLTFERVMRAERTAYSDLPTMKFLAEKEAEALRNPGDAVTELRRMMQQDRKIVIATVNLDRLVEDGLDSGLVRVFASDSEFAEAPSYLASYFDGDETMVPILKFHGSIDRPDTYVIDDIQTGYGLSPSKRHTLRALTGTSTHRRRWIYVGASMRDIDLNGELKSGDMKEGMSETWVMPHAIATVEDFARSRRQQWAADPTNLPTLFDRSVTETADVFFTQLARAW